MGVSEYSSVDQLRGRAHFSCRTFQDTKKLFKVASFGQKRATVFRSFPRGKTGHFRISKSGLLLAEDYF